jgi:hypothetical protein
MIIVNGNMENSWKEGTVTHFKTISSVRQETEENHENLSQYIRLRVESRNRNLQNKK